MPEENTRTYPYNIRRQSHPTGSASKENSADKSTKPTESSRNKAGPQQKTSMATAPKGTPIIAPGGRKSRAKGYPGIK